jgi:hypothetical protein
MTGGDYLAELLTELRERFAPDADVREVEIYLASRGYDARQIGEILAVFASHHDGRDEPAGDTRPADPGSTGTRLDDGPTFRVMGAYERSRFAPEAWGYLVGLTAAGVLPPADREHLIERALMQTDGRVGLGELRALLEGAGFDDGGPPGALTIH